jgi:hypothetical protein
MDIDDADLTGLCAELRTILAAELVAGNRIERVSGDLDEWPLVVVLSDPFRCSHDPLPDGVRYREINSPSLWKAHYLSLDHAQILACGFGDG